MDYDEEVYDSLLYNLKFLCNVIGQKTESDYIKADLTKVEKIINKEIPDVVKKHTPENFYEIYMEFKAEYEKFRSFILYDKLIGKNIIALGGGFSSGKSSFLNALLGKNALPAGINPSTSVPTYIVYGEKNEVTGMNIFDKTVSMNLRDIKKIAHGFGQIFDDDDVQVTEEVTLGHILEHLLLSTPFLHYKRVAFLDTPGYSKNDREQEHERTDAKIARVQLNTANYILWFVQADGGTITENDIRFIKSLRKDIPILIVVNKADKKTIQDLKEIIEKIRSTLTLKGVRFLDIRAFTSRPEQVENTELKEFINSDTVKIMEKIQEWNNQPYEANFAWNFKQLFVQCSKYYDSIIEGESRKLDRLNTSVTKLGAEDIDSEILEPLQQIIREVQKKISEWKEIKNQLKKLQKQFFAEIKKISDVVGIDMPEPSMIDLLRSKVRDPLDVLQEYKKKNKIRTKGNTEAFLESVFDTVNPVFARSQGNGRYSEELLKFMDEFRQIPAEKIHLNAVFHRAEEYADIMGRKLQDGKDI